MDLCLILLACAGALDEGKTRVVKLVSDGNVVVRCLIAMAMAGDEDAKTNVWGNGAYRSPDLPPSKHKRQ